MGRICTLMPCLPLRSVSSMAALVDLPLPGGPTIATTRSLDERRVEISFARSSRETTLLGTPLVSSLLSDIERLFGIQDWQYASRTASMPFAQISERLSSNARAKRGSSARL